MKYFAKYLSVEEEIKVGDTFRWDGSYHTAAAQLEESLVGAFILTTEGRKLVMNKEDSKVKMFLCTRDIQMGDTVLDIYRNTEQLIDTDAKLQLALLQIRALVRVIGEISPAALYFVKEGDTFDEEHIKIFSLFSIGKDLVKMSKDLKREWIEDYTCEIQGPCGHFH